MSSLHPVLIPCAACGALNRVPHERLLDAPDCGRCHSALLPAAPITLTDAGFDAFVMRCGLPVLVDFWAPWCGPCRAMAPAFEQAAQALRGQAVLVKVNTDENPVLATRFGIRSIPTLVALQGGRERQRASGALPAAQIVAMGRAAS